MQINIRLPYEVCKVVDGKKEIIEVIAGSPLEAMWAAYRSCVTMKTYSQFSDWKRDFDEETGADKIEHLKKIKWIKNKAGQLVFQSEFLKND